MTTVGSLAQPLGAPALQPQMMDVERSWIRVADMAAHDVRCEQTGAIATALAVEWGVWQKTS